MTSPNRRSTDDNNVRWSHIIVFLIVAAVAAIGFTSKVEREDKQSIEAARTVGMVAHKINVACGL